jgi:intermediate cleaving peptidase 55
VRPKDAHAELWDGARTGVDMAMETFNADHAYDVAHLHYHISPILERATTVYADIPRPSNNAHSTFFSTSRGSTLSSILEGKQTRPLKQTMHALRVFKSGAEAAVMRKVGKISGRAYNEAMRRGFAGEKELADFLEYEFKKGGCDTSAYVPVVAGGENALSIHYTSNNSLFRYTPPSPGKEVQGLNKLQRGRYGPSRRRWGEYVIPLPLTSRTNNASTTAATALT